MSLWKIMSDKKKTKLSLKSNNIEFLETKKKDKKKKPEKMLPDYESRYKPKFCRMLIDHLQAGYSLNSFAGTLFNKGESYVSTRTIFRWIKRYPAFRKAKETGESLALRYYETLVTWYATGVFPPELANLQTKDPHKGLAMVIFILKSRFRHMYGTKLQFDGLPENSNVKVENKEVLDLRGVKTKDIQLLLELADESSDEENAIKDSTKEIEYKNSKS